MWSPAVLPITGGILIHLALGSFYTYGNMAPYFSSHIFYSDPTSADYNDLKSKISFGFAAGLIGQASLMCVGGYLERRWGARWTVLLGCSVMIAGILLTTVVYDTVVGLVLVYGLIRGAGIGCTYAVPIVVAMRWLPSKKGLATGLIVAGFGAGSLVFTQIQTTIINPGNKDPLVDPHDPDETGPYPESVADNTQLALLVLAASYAALEFIGMLLLRNPPLPTVEVKERLLKSDVGNSSSAKSKPQECDTHDAQSVRRVIASPSFWYLYIPFMINGIVAVFLSSEWKILGEERGVADDKYRSVVGSTSSIFNALGRICFGLLLDRLGFCATFILLCVVWSAFLATLDFVGTLSAAWYMVWICATFFCLGGNYAVFAPKVSELFGQAS